MNGPNRKLFSRPAEKFTIMKASVKLYLNDGSSKKRFPVKLIVTHQKKIRRKTFAHSRADDWDLNSQMPRPTHPDFENLYSRIAQINILASRMEFRELEDLEAAMDFFNQNPDSEDSQNDSFYDFADQQIRDMIAQGRHGNAKAYQFTVDQLKKFAPDLPFDHITRFFLENFKAVKKSEGLKNTSIRTYLYEIRAIYNKAVRLGVCEDRRPFVGLFMDLPVRKRRYKNQYLDREGIDKLKNISGVSRQQQVAVDLALLQFYMGGLDLVDLYHLKKDQIAGGRVYLMRKKLGAKGEEFDIKLLDTAKKLIDKYWNPNGPYVFPWSKDLTRYESFRSNYNTKLKRIQKNAGIQVLPTGGVLTSKVMRHTFATLGKFQHLDPDLIRELMGHERNEIDTIYKDRFPKNVRDQALHDICGD